MYDSLQLSDYVIEYGLPNMSADQRTPDESRMQASSETTAGGTELSGNRLLAGIPAHELAPLRAAAERVRPRMREVLHEQGSSMPYAYFPQGGVFSLLAEMSDGSVIETLTVGNEGMIGLPAVMGASRSATKAICQISGWAIRVPMPVLLAAAPRDGVLFDRLARYTQARMASLSRSVACNRMHTAQQRYARWVLATLDRVGAEEFPITQDFLSQMLGVTRPTVSLVGQELQASGLIHYAQGRLTVDDRAGLERTTCECYAAVRDVFEELLDVRRG